MSTPHGASTPPAPAPGGPRWPLRVFMVAAVVLGVGLYLFPGAKTVLLVGFVAAVAWAAWGFWDATRGASHALVALRQRWVERVGAIEDGADLHLAEDRQPLIVRLDRRGAATTVAILTPLPETTAAFRMWPRAMPKPGFDGREPPVGGPLLTPLPALETVLGGAYAIEGNEPAVLARWLDEELVQALLTAEVMHPGRLRGLTFDGRFLAVHWVASTPGVGDDPADTLTASSPLWRAFVPRLPRVTASLMH